MADTLFRSQAEANVADLSLIEEVEFCVSQSQSLHASQSKLQELAKLPPTDEILAQVIKFVSGSWPAYLSSDDVDLRPYFENRSYISLQNKLLTLEDRIIIPQTERVKFSKLCMEAI